MWENVQSIRRGCFPREHLLLTASDVNVFKRLLVFQIQALLLSLANAFADTASIKPISIAPSSTISKLCHNGSRSLLRLSTWSRKLLRQRHRLYNMCSLWWTYAPVSFFFLLWWRAFYWYFKGWLSARDVLAVEWSGLHAQSMLPTSQQAILVPTMHRPMAATLVTAAILVMDSSQVMDLLPRIRPTNPKGLAWTALVPRWDMRDHCAWFCRMGMLRRFDIWCLLGLSSSVVDSSFAAFVILSLAWDGTRAFLTIHGFVFSLYEFLHSVTVQSEFSQGF